MNKSEMLKLAYELGVGLALGTIDVEKLAAANPGFFAKLFGFAPKDPARARALARVLQGGDATATEAFAKLRATGAPRGTRNLRAAMY
jgi:hypothetical protein